MKAKPQVYEAFRKRAELLTEAQAAGPEHLARVLKMLHVADMAAAKGNKLAGDTSLSCADMLHFQKRRKSKQGYNLWRPTSGKANKDTTSGGQQAENDALAELDPPRDSSQISLFGN